MPDSPKRTPRRSKRERTRDRIAEVGVALMQRQGFEATTMEQIAAAADVVRGTLYNHFPVKDAVIVHWLHGQLREVLGPLMAEAMERSGFMSRAATLLDASARWWEAHRSFALPYIRHRFLCFVEGQGDDPTSDVIPAYEQLIALAQQTGELSPAVPAGRLASYLHFLALSALLDWLAVPDRPLADRYADALEFFMEGAQMQTITPMQQPNHMGRTR